MAKYIPGQVFILPHDSENDSTVFCEILAYKGGGYYYVHIYKNAVIDVTSRKHLKLWTLHHAEIEEWALSIEDISFDMLTSEENEDG